MRRQGNLFDRIPEWGNLRLAVAKALRGKRSKAEVREFTSRLDANLRRLQAELMDGTIKLGRIRQFTIHDPKERLITAPCFEERVIHHAVMNVCEENLERYLLHDSYACRRGKGREECLLRAQRFSRRYPWYLKLDIRKYFDSIDHGRLLGLLARRFKDQQLLRLFERIVVSHCVTVGKGLPIGSLTSQHFANFYLGHLDYFIKQQLRAPGYVRYMDDMVVWGTSSQQLGEWLKRITLELDVKLRLALEVPQINSARHGLDLLGCRVFPTHRTLNRRSRSRFVKKLKSLESEFRRGELDEASLQRRGQALVAFTTTSGVKSWQFRRAVLNKLSGDGLGQGARDARRQLEQQRQELPVSEPQQERAGEPEREPEQRLPPGCSSSGT